MIFDKVENIGTYLGINHNLDIAIREIQKGTYVSLDKGKHEIAGSDVYCNVVSLETKEQNSWERHEEYLDIHVIVDGAEKIRYAEKNAVCGWGPLDKEGDYSIAQYTTDGIELVLEQGWFFMAFPQDAHMPGIGTGTISNKAIFKVKM